jgi:hypothetical protein
MGRFILSASKVESEDDPSHLYRLYESPDFPVIGDEVDVAGTFVKVIARQHWKVNSLPIILAIAIVEEPEWGKIKTSKDWKSTLEDVVTGMRIR